MGGGGGGAVRVAGKLSRINGGGSLIGGIKSVSLPEQYMSTTTTTSPNQTSKNVSVVSTTTNEDGGGKPAVLLSDSSLNKSSSSSWGIDDWEFASVDSMNSMPRVVFGRVPSLEEAEEATSQLKQALDTSGYTETSACVTPSQNSVARTSIPNPVFQAFSLLQTSPECQEAVASIASDKTIWDAVMRNQKVQDFIKSKQASANESVLDNEKASDCVRNEDDEKHHEEDTTNGFTEFIQKIKVAVADMSSNLYGVVLSIIGGPKEENVSLDSKGTAAAAAIETNTAASLMALAVMAIMVVVLKRV